MVGSGPQVCYLVGLAFVFFCCIRPREPYPFLVVLSFIGYFALVVVIERASDNATRRVEAMKLLWLVWLLFAVVFFGLGTWHLVQSTSAIPPFTITQRPVPGSMGLMGLDVDKPLTDFAAEFNAYLSTQNEASRKANLMATCGYFLAAMTALFSMWLQGRRPSEKLA